MTLNEYQDRAMTTCMDSCENFSYMFINLVGEIGEFASKVAKQIRKEQMGIGIYGEENQLIYEHRVPLEHVNLLNTELMKEAGDMLWQLSGLCSTLGWSLEDVAQQNLDKLASRKQRDVIDGEGDNR